VKAGEKGAVLMEYVLLCCLVAVLIIWTWKAELYDFKAGWRGTLGTALLQFYQRVLGAIALPIP